MQSLKQGQQIQQDINRNINNESEQIHDKILQDSSDQYDALQSSQLKKSDLKQSAKQQLKYENKPIQQNVQQQQNKEQQKKQQQIEQNANKSRINLHQYYPALSKSLQQQNQQKQQQKQNEQIINKALYQSYKLDFNLDINQAHQQQQQNDSNINKSSNEQIGKNKKIIFHPSQYKFQKYLNQELSKIQNSDHSDKIILSKQLYSPINKPYNYSLRSGDSLFYDPQKSSLNLSRSYIPNFHHFGNPTIYQFSPFQDKQKQLIQKKLKQIFHYYAQSYLQPTKYYQTFDSVKKRTMSFQSFCLFAKDFKILKIIFTLQTIKKQFKKHSQFGKVLLFKNFANLIEGLAHQKQCNTYFKLQLTVPDMNNQTRQSFQIRQLYVYLGLHQDLQNIKQKFSKLFHPFGCQKQAELPKLKYNYRRFSVPDLHKKALPQLKQKKVNKKQVIQKSQQNVKSSNPFDQQKSIVISWQILRAKSTQNLGTIKYSSNKAKKLIKQDPQDKIYLNEYKQTKSLPRSVIQKKLNEIKKIQIKKPHKAIENLQKIEDKIIALKLQMQRKLSVKN